MDALMLDRRDFVRELLVDRGGLLVVCGLGSPTWDVAAAGDLATIGVKAPNNLAVVVLDNARYGETGMQPSHTDAGVDLAAVALACRFKEARAVSRMEDAAEVRDLLHNGQGPILINARIKADDTARVLPLRDGHAIKQRFVEALNASTGIAHPR
jgi:thiamine pyrophosphate-dependent acetolactate synthase large subunit-like protein